MINVARVLIVCCCLSLSSCAIVVISILFENRATKSTHLGLVVRLLVSNMCLSFILLTYSVNVVTGSSNLSQLCNGYLPFLMYFFVASYGWTIFIAFRFREGNSRNLTRSEFNGMRKQIYFGIVWVVSFLLQIPVIIFDIVYPGQVSAIASSATTRACVYNHSNEAGYTIDLITVQIPVLFTISINLYSYTRGILALVKDTPQSVVARQMRRAGGYLLVLIIVWAPNLAYNIISILYKSNTASADFLDFTLCLAALQGFLNVCFYVYTNGRMRKWIYDILCRRKICCEKDRSQALLERSQRQTPLDEEFGVNNLSDSSEEDLRDSTQATRHQSRSAPQGILASKKAAASNYKKDDFDTEKMVRFASTRRRHRVSDATADHKLFNCSPVVISTRIADNRNSIHTIQSFSSSAPRESELAAWGEMNPRHRETEVTVDRDSL